MVNYLRRSSNIKVIKHKTKPAITDVFNPSKTLILADWESILPFNSAIIVMFRAFIKLKYYSTNHVKSQGELNV